MKVTVIGAGAWGTALANLLRQNQYAVTIWGHNAAHLRAMEQTRRNEVYLPGIPLAPELKYQPDLAEAATGSQCIVVAVPSKFFRDVTGRLPDFFGHSRQRHQRHRAGNRLDHVRHLARNHAEGDSRGLVRPDAGVGGGAEIPAAVVGAHADAEIAKQVQRLFHRPTFRVYTCNDVLGVELGGALKNVAAIAAGIGDGVGFGDNAKAGLITRAIAEMRRLGVACGASSETFSGLSGLGDLTVTCFSRLSRNRAFGERVGRGEKVEAILASTLTVAEGYPTARAAHKLARRLSVATPIIDEVYAALYEEKDIRKSVRDLMTRDMKQED